MFDSMNAAEKRDPHGIASRIVEIMAQACDHLVELKAGALSEFVGLTTEEPSGRRPSGVKLGGQLGRSQPGRGRGRGKGRGGTSTAPPRGPTCSIGHLRRAGVTSCG